MCLALSGLVAGITAAVAAEPLAGGVSLINVAAAETAEVPPETAAEAVKAENGEEGEEGEPAPAPLWPEMPAVEADKQPFVLIRALRSVQDKVAAGSATAHEQQRQLMQSLGTEMTALPVAVWDDVRNVRAAIFFVLSGGNPAVLKAAAGRAGTPLVERRVLRGAMAYGEGRVIDALGLLHKIEARSLDPLLAGIVALIQGTLITKKDARKAIHFFDEARLLSPGTLIEESALRQQILLVAREGEVERFDMLTAQYSRRFPNSLFARSFRRQFFAGVARQNFKRASEWISRTETELMKVPATERAGLYLAIAEEATKGGNIDIARFAASKARELSRADSRSFQRAKLFEGAALAATHDFEQGVLLLNDVDVAQVGASDREIRDSALAVAGAVGRWPAVSGALEEAEPESVGRARALLTEVDTLLGGSSP
ncbi:hypothetical protein [Hyphomicrobium sp.]|uniref:hypothetical protein n=1 Tax=Hyphomicrobium sp. TaxID=82 RepID=UPI0025C580E3|nr:hypothetical protein [Hyphomicrobium sp.]MCC7251465.1 hypothetical protein [Hyphomicrobium sp.]